MYIPKPIYEVLPFIYVLIALAGLFAPANYGRLCGVVLIIAAYEIYRMRRAYRSQLGVKNDKN